MRKAEKVALHAAIQGDLAEIDNKMRRQGLQVDPIQVVLMRLNTLVEHLCGVLPDHEHQATDVDGWDDDRINFELLYVRTMLHNFETALQAAERAHLAAGNGHSGLIVPGAN